MAQPGWRARRTRRGGAPPPGRRRDAGSAARPAARRRRGNRCANARRGSRCAAKRRAATSSPTVAGSEAGPPLSASGSQRGDRLGKRLPVAHDADLFFHDRPHRARHRALAARQPAAADAACRPACRRRCPRPSARTPPPRAASCWPGGWRRGARWRQPRRRPRDPRPSCARHDRPRFHPCDSEPPAAPGWAAVAGSIPASRQAAVMPGKRWAKRGPSAARASRKTRWPAAIWRQTARETTSRGSSSARPSPAMKRVPASSMRIAPSPRTASLIKRHRVETDIERGGMELDELHIREARRRHARRAPGRARWSRADWSYGGRDSRCRR